MEWSLIHEVTKEMPCEKRRHYARYGLYKCSCGIEKVVNIYTVNSGRSTSCGHSRRYFLQIPTPKYGKLGATKNIREYAVWKAMKDRCYNKNRRNYRNWGGRGIKVCESWLSSFQSFIDDMGIRPGEGYSIDRIDNDGNYCKENCRWATSREQRINQRKRSVT